MLKPLDILEQYWRFNAFNPEQAKIIESILQGNDTLVLLPTGGGKSICFQVPALVNKGICIVVSPLIALMKDQVESLKEKGIKAIALTGGLKPQDVDSLLDNCIYGNYKFLYLSPERLQQELVLDRINQMQVNLIAIDEAHCISEWGNDFRPAYRNCTILREIFPDIPFVALTASATTKVVEDIVENLQMKSNMLTFQKSFVRPNIAYMVFEEVDKFYKLTLILKKNQGSSIVYVRNRRACVDVSQYLNDEGITSTFYHGGISVEEKDKRLNQWLSDEIQVMVATNAFGMGIDKPDVKTVIHINLPDTLESYYQEAGRCGRNGEKAFAILLKNKNDENQVKQQFLAVLPDVDFLKLLYRKLNTYFQVSYGEGQNETFSLNFNEFCKIYNLNQALVYNGMKVLDKHSIINLSETFHKKTQIQFIAGNHELFLYLDRNPKLEKITQTILRTYGGIFENETKINTLLIADKSQTKESAVNNALKQLEKDGIIACKIHDTDAEITFLVPREDDNTINVIAKYVKQQNRLKAEKVQAVINYIHNEDVCKSVQLLNYFGEEDVEACGICSVCSNSNKPTEILSMISEEIIKCLKKQPLTSRGILQKLTFNEISVLEAIRMLLEQQKININSKNEYQIIK